MAAINSSFITLTADGSPMQCYTAAPSGNGIVHRCKLMDLRFKADELLLRMLFFWGGQDKHITKETIDAIIGEMDKAEKKYTNVVISDADHGFFCDERSSYNPVAAKEAWALTLSFLETGLDKMTRKNSDR